MRPRRILVPFDMGPPAERALDIAIALGQRFDADVALLYAFYIPPIAYASGISVPYDAMATDARRELGAAVAAARARFPRVEPIWVDGDPRQAIPDAVRSSACDLVVMGTHGRRGIPRAVLGSVAATIVRTSIVPVLTTPAYDESLPKAATTTFRHVLAATDFGAAAEDALAMACLVANAFGSKLTILHASDVSSLFSDAATRSAVEGQARLALDALLAKVRPEQPSVNAQLVHADPRTAIVDAAHEENADLIVMGAPNHRGAARLLVGSVVDSVVRTSRVPVLTVPGLTHSHPS